MKVVKYHCDSCGQWVDDAGRVSTPKQDFDFCITCCLKICSAITEVISEIQQEKQK